MKTVSKLLSALVITATTMSANAEDFGKIESYHENIRPIESDGQIEVIVNAVTNSQGQIFLPAYEDGKVLSAVATKGILNSSTAKVEKIHGRDVLVYQFKNANAAVLLNQTLNVTKLYKEKKAKLKYSHPGGVKRVSYEFINSSPVAIGKYVGSLGVPQGKELYGVVLPEWSKKKKTFFIGEQDGYKTVDVVKKKLKPGSEVEFRIRTYQPAAAIKWTMWTLVILLSGALLWKRRDVLNDLDSASNAQKSVAN
ncbi:hypothetical protein [Aliivibrio kagoshimensis]|uniref:hypothetical protein n=1 Tax=Aliivibrio kagoshimensis TaxID=2910230 RepID=UPI003D141A89